ncbi:hypothetical protein A5658_25900 [Mycobacterium sp. 1245111.1]|uniref:DedA family protein n=1 Tax=Mycobacterium sp. 1245111.1 TaxID=1834073 RepID=UPI0007FC7141|nr:DedA family protein [Mycobacterium sp. 1245111.1]OBK38787.1 hypothetical protein A5658_25900 [Mycobacterium sp. 1245111.1]
MQQFIVSFGLLAIFVLMVVEAAGIPIASEATMLLGGALAGGAMAGVHMDLALVILVGTAGNVVGSYLAWAAGHYGGQAALRRWGGGRRTDTHLDRAIRWFDRHGASSVFFGRLVPVVRTFISLPAGLANMPPLRFGVYTFLGCLPWTAALAGIGYGIGGNWRAAAHALHSPPVIAVGATAVAITAAALVLGRRRSRRRLDQRQSRPRATSHRSQQAQPEQSLLLPRTERERATACGATRR